MEWSNIHWVIDDSIKKALDDFEDEFKDKNANLFDFLIAWNKGKLTYSMVHEGIQAANRAMDKIDRVENTLQESISTTVKSAVGEVYDRAKNDLKFTLCHRVFQDAHKVLNSDLGTQFNKIIDRVVEKTVQNIFTIGPNSQLQRLQFVEQWMHCMYTRLKNIERATRLYDEYYDTSTRVKRGGQDQVDGRVHIPLLKEDKQYVTVHR